LVAVFLVLLTRVAGLGSLLLVGLPLTMVAAARSGPFQALLSDIVPSDMRGSLMGIRAAAVNLGIGLFTWLGGDFYGRFDYQRLLYAAAATVVVAYFLVRIGMRGRQ
jgi:predicted MFS family arabinose efflux permease